MQLSMWSKANLMIYQGDDYGAIVTVADGVTPAAEIIAGYTAQAQIRSGIADEQTTVAAEIACTVVLPNQISLSLTHGQTAALGEQWYQWDLQLVSAGNIVTTILRGKANLGYEITRETAPALVAVV